MLDDATDVRDATDASAKPLLVGLAAASAAVVALVRLGRDELRRERAASAARDELASAVDRALEHVERLDAERAGLNGRIAKLERRLAGKERQLARLQAFDAERRTLEPAPRAEPPAEQLTLDAVLAAEELAAGDAPAPAPAPARPAA